MQDRTGTRNIPGGGKFARWDQTEAEGGGAAFRQDLGAGPASTRPAAREQSQEAAGGGRAAPGVQAPLKPLKARADAKVIKGDDNPFNVMSLALGEIKVFFDEMVKGNVTPELLTRSRNKLRELLLMLSADGGLIERAGGLTPEEEHLIVNAWKSI